MRHILGVSVPRSGHHLLAQLLTDALAPGLFHCTFTAADCCKRFPCSRHQQAAVVYQKNHDDDLRHPTEVAGASILVQIRNPAFATISLRELELARAVAPDGRLYMEYWLGLRAAYCVRFHRKWLATKHATVLPLRYEDLTADPMAAMRRVLDWIGQAEVHEDTLRRVIAKYRNTRAGARTQPYKPRVTLDSSPVFDRGLMEQFEGYIHALCDWSPQDYAPVVATGPGAVADTVISESANAVLAESRGEFGLAIDHAARAAGLAQDNPFTSIRLGRMRFLAGDLDPAETDIRYALEIASSPAAWNQLSEIVERQGHLEEAIRCMERAVETEHPLPDHHERLRLLLSYRSRQGILTRLFARLGA